MQPRANSNGANAHKNNNATKCNSVSQQILRWKYKAWDKTKVQVLADAGRTDGHSDGGVLNAATNKLRKTGTFTSRKLPPACRIEANMNSTDR